MIARSQARYDTDHKDPEMVGFAGSQIRDFTIVPAPAAMKCERLSRPPALPSS